MISSRKYMITLAVCQYLPTVSRSHNCRWTISKRAEFSPSVGLVLGVVFLCLTLLASLAIGAEPEAIQRLQPKIVNGLTTHAYPTSANLLRGFDGPIDENNAIAWCSATLIGSQTILTAAHCVEGADPAEFMIYLQHAGFFQVASIATHPDFVFPVADVAVLKLSTPVTGIEPTPLNAVDPSSFIPYAGTIVGFGTTSGFAYDYGIKRVGTVQTVDCTTLANGDLDNTSLICWRFDTPIGLPGEDSNTCYGDSGGPLFMDLGAGQVVAGITSGGINGSCLTSDFSYDTNVFTYRDFVLSQLGTDVTTTAGNLPPVGSEGVTVLDNSGTLNEETLSESFTVTVGENVNVVRFALNGEDNGLFNVDFFVKAGPGASPSDFDCKGDGTSVFGACEIESPTAGTWSVFVSRVSGAGEYQVTTTLFTGNGSALSNGLPVTGLNGVTGDERPFTIEVPAGATELTIQLSGGSGDADLYVRHGAAPTLSDYDCRPYLDGNEEICTIAAPAAGTWHIMVKGFADFADVTLTATFMP